jgi:outer membrane protein TolC
VYFRTAYIDRAIRIMEDTRELLRGFLEVSSTRYAVGEGLQQDVLQAQVAVAQMTEDITIMEQNRLALSARLNALLGREATTPIGPLELEEELAALESVDALMDAAVEARPALRAAQERTRAAEAGYRAARRAVYPDFTLTLGYGERPQFVDLATVMVGITIPLWAGARQLTTKPPRGSRNCTPKPSVRGTCLPSTPTRSCLRLKPRWSPRSRPIALAGWIT